MTVRDEEFSQWLDELKHIFRTGYGYTDAEAEAYCSVPGDWRDFFDDGYTPRQAAAEDAAAGL